jgi:hypothetical protein
MNFGKCSRAVAIAVGALAAAAGTAHGQYYARNWHERTITTPGPTRGYTGSVRVGARKYWCDYVRYPNRECSNGKCRIVSWDLKQRCY